MSKKLWLLGAEDPEMVVVEGLLREAGETVVYAAVEDPNASKRGVHKPARRVTPREAYESNELLFASEKDRRRAFDAIASGEAELVNVECDSAGSTIPSAEGVAYNWHTPDWWGYGGDFVPITRVDHHRPGDPGYGRPPEEFLPASSLGQALKIFGLGVAWADFSDPLQCPEPGVPEAGVTADLVGAPGLHQVRVDKVGSLRADVFDLPDAPEWAEEFYAPDLLLTAAADHCLAAAYAGRCPGVDPKELSEFRVKQLCHVSRASARGATRTPDEVRASIEVARKRLSEAPRVELGGVTLADMRGPMVPDLPEAAMAEGVGYLAGGVPLREGDKAKIVIGGCGEGTVPGTAPVEAFLSAAREDEVVGTSVDPESAYGDPVRGFAGAYIYTRPE